MHLPFNDADGRGYVPYGNTSNDRIKDTLAKAQSMLLDDPFTQPKPQETGNFGYGPSTTFGQPDYGARGSTTQSRGGGYGGGGILRSQYTNSDAGESEFETHSQFQQQPRRRQWGGAPSGDGGNYSLAHV